MDPHQPEVFNPWIDKLAKTANVHIAQLKDLLDALAQAPSGISTISAAGCPTTASTRPTRPTAPTRRRRRSSTRRARARAATPHEREAFASYMMVFFGHLDAEKGWTKQLHLGARRNANTRGLKTLGRDTGYDSIGDLPQVDALGRYLDRLEQDNALPKTVIYNLNPADNYAFATMIGNFQDGSVAGKIQFGSGWWFLDQKEAMEWQMNALSNNGLLSHFVGMLTDSRSFMSYPRHEYFRRVLCNLLGREMENGELPDDEEMIGATGREDLLQERRAVLRADTVTTKRPSRARRHETQKSRSKLSRVHVLDSTVRLRRSSTQRRSIELSISCALSRNVAAPISSSICCGLSRADDRRRDRRVAQRPGDRHFARPAAVLLANRAQALDQRLRLREHRLLRRTGCSGASRPRAATRTAPASSCRSAAPTASASTE